MAFDQGLAARLTELVETELSDKQLTHTGMFGGHGYLMNGNMCFGIHRTTLIIRVGTDVANRILSEPYVRPMDLTGKVMKAWATLEPEAISEDSELLRYCQLACDFVASLPAK